MRTIVDLPEEQIKALAELCKREGISRAEAIRRAVEALTASMRPPKKDISHYFGMWKDRDDIGDGVEYQRRLRAEWDHREPKP